MVISARNLKIYPKQVLLILSILGLTGLFIIISAGDGSAFQEIYTNTNKYFEKGHSILIDQVVLSQQELEEKLINKEVQYSRRHIRYIPPSVTRHLQEIAGGELNWEKYAYVQYATSLDYSCNALMNFAKLRQYNVKARLVLVSTPTAVHNFVPRMKKVIEELNIEVKMVSDIYIDGDDPKWSSSFTKFRVFELIDYERVVYFDSDATVLQNMDELFFMPDADVILPLAYEEAFGKLSKRIKKEFPNDKLEKKYSVCEGKSAQEKQDYEATIIRDAKLDAVDKGIEITDKQYARLVHNRLPYLEYEKVVDGYFFGSHFMVIKPSTRVFNSLVQRAMLKKSNDYDMDLINDEFSLANIIREGNQLPDGLLLEQPTLLILPHSQYGILSGNFRFKQFRIIEMDPIDFECFAGKQAMREYKEAEKKLAEELKKGAVSVSEKMKRDEAGDEQKKKEEEIKQRKENAESKRVWENIKLVHFSDSPVPKPWNVRETDASYLKSLVVCRSDTKRLSLYPPDKTPTLVFDCAASEYWNTLYEQFEVDRKEICDLDLIGKKKVVADEAKVEGETVPKVEEKTKPKVEQENGGKVETRKI